ncbi:EF-hand domain-containing family member B isoform X1 [Cynoglossus semilaevis]|uniref:EF-hand domain-containing family member B n=1 Tax=Cynoglossus semilaevis TaxID=244447 RepID=A0A3P8UXL8_CYNSE|nr:EF-hand domain-containing family member B isoform X1 [Cynoglossus semilaevis]
MKANNENEAPQAKYNPKVPTIQTLINPRPKTGFQNKLQELSEAVYQSTQRAPLGKSRFQAPDDIVHGLKTDAGFDIRQIIYPSKKCKELEDEELHKAYVLSHKSYFVGEQIDRNYNSGHFSKYNRFGICTPHHKDGREVSESLCWQGETNKELKDSERLRMQRLALNLPQDYRFGNNVPPDEFGAGEIIHCTEPGQYIRGPEPQLSLVNLLRHDLKRLNNHHFSSLLEAFKYYDKTGKGLINKEDIKTVFRKFQLNFTDDVIKDLVEFCDTDKDGHINFVEFANFLNWKDTMPIDEKDQEILTKEPQAEALDDTEQFLVQPGDLEPVTPGSSMKTVRRLRLDDSDPEQFVTTSSYIGAFSRFPLRENRTYGIPSVRSDLPAPTIKSVCDFTNYGDMTTAADLLYPTAFSQHGVYREHLQCPRSRKEITQIFMDLGLDLSEETFEKAWKLAAEKDPKGRVCIENFRSVLKELNVYGSIKTT